MTLKLKIDDLALIPGPEEIPQPYSSVNVQSIADYASVDIASALLEADSIELKEVQLNSMWDWRAVLKESSANITFEMSCMGENDEYWGGFLLEGYGDKKHILKAWNSLTVKGFTAVYLHDGDCNMYTKSGFIKEYSEYS